MDRNLRSKSPGTVTTALPDDLLGQILDRIADPADRKAWRLAGRAFLGMDYNQRKSLKMLRHVSLPSILRKFGSLEQLDLSACARIDDGAIRAAFCRIRLRNLKHINLSRRTALRWQGLAFLVRACPALETVDLSFCPNVGDREMAALARASSLRELNLTRCLGVTDYGLARVATGCTDLERISLKWCLEISDIGVDFLVKKCRSLKDLDISYLRVTNASLRSISSLEKLECLSMVSCSLIDDAGLVYLENVSSSLLSVNCARCEHVTSDGLGAVINSHSRLQMINAGHCHPDISPTFEARLKHLEKSLFSIKLDRFNLSSSAIRTIGLHCKNLVEIGLGKCEGITDSCISNIASNCPYLRTVDLTCCHAITDSSLVDLTRSCRDLRCLMLESCTGIRGKGLSKIGDFCPNLSEIDLTDCRIGDEALKYLSKCPNLIQLKLGLCPSITDEGLTYIGQNCRNLEELDLYRCSGIGDEGLLEISRGCRKMRRMNLCYCSEITDEGMKWLGELERLMELEMRELVRVTGVGVASMAAGCRSLVKLDTKMCRFVDDVGFLAVARHCQNLRQMNISHCPISDGALCVLLGSLSALQDVKLMHLLEVSPGGFELALRTAWDHLQKLKLSIHVRPFLSDELMQMLQARCCRVRWVDKSIRH